MNEKMLTKFVQLQDSLEEKLKKVPSGAANWSHQKAVDFKKSQKKVLIF
jgi:hypothetical protein